MSRGWSRGYSRKALLQAGIGNAALERLVEMGMARRSRYHRRRYNVMVPSLTPESAAELLAALRATERLQERRSNTTLEVNGVDFSDFLTSGIVKVEDELIAYTSKGDGHLTVKRGSR